MVVLRLDGLHRRLNGGQDAVEIGRTRTFVMFPLPNSGSPSTPEASTQCTSPSCWNSMNVGRIGAISFANSAGECEVVTIIAGTPLQTLARNSNIAVSLPMKGGPT